MSAGDAALASGPGLPRHFPIAGARVNSYKVFLCIGLCSGILLSAGVAVRSGLSPLRVGAAGLACAVLGLAGARAYHLAVNLGARPRPGSRASAWNPRGGGASVLGGLVVVPMVLLGDSLFGVPGPALGDHLALGVALGGAWIRLGCVFNGCCVGRESRSRLAVLQHDVRGVRRRRLPAQWMEIAWWALACLGLALVWSWPRTPGACALGVLAWYGLGRAWMETLREPGDLLLGRIPVNQVVGAALAVAAGSALVFATIGPHVR